MTYAKLTQQAAKFAERIIKGDRRPLSYDDLRHMLDQWTCSELDYQPLNILTDSVWIRLNHAGYPLTEEA